MFTSFSDFQNECFTEILEKLSEKHVWVAGNNFFVVDFMPVFTLIDDIIGAQTQYVGNYNLTIIGGGVTIDKIVMYSAQEQFDYNHRRG